MRAALTTRLFTMACAITLLCCNPVVGQALKKEGMTGQLDSLNRRAYDYPVQVLRACDSLLTKARNTNNAKEEGLLLMIKGVAETSLGNDNAALRNHMRSYHLFDSINYNYGKIYSLCNIAITHLNMYNYKEGREYALKALAITDKDDHNNLKTIYVNLGVSYEYEENDQKAIEYYRKAIPHLEKMKDYNGMAITYHNIGGIYNETGDYANAQLYNLKALEYQKRSGSKNTLAMISFSLADIYREYKEYKKAGEYLESGHALAQELKSPYYMDLYYEGMARLFEKKGDHRNRAIYLERLIVHRDSTFSEEKLAATTALEAEFRNSLKTKEIELLKTQKKLDDEKIERNTITRWVSLIILLLCLVIIFVLYRNYRLKQRANLLLGYEKLQLEEENLQLENENILVQFDTLKNQVSPHFLFNSLNALASLIKSDPDKAVEFTGVFAKIFRNVLELKDRHLIKLHEELQHVNNYFYLQKMRFGDSLLVNTSIPADRLNDYLPHFSLQMVVENAIKHNAATQAQPLHITISVEGDYLKVVNNLQYRRNVEDSTGMGINNIISRYKFLNAAVPVFEVVNNEYIAKLPLIKEE